MLEVGSDFASQFASGSTHYFSPEYRERRESLTRMHSLLSGLPLRGAQESGQEDLQVFHRRLDSHLASVNLRLSLSHDPYMSLARWWW